MSSQPAISSIKDMSNPLSEAEVHDFFRKFLRWERASLWSHHLTMARLVARSIRLRESSLLQTGTTVEKYYLSFLVPALLSEEPTLLVVREEIQELLWLSIRKIEPLLSKPSYVSFTTPSLWLQDKLNNYHQFPEDIITIIPEGDELEYHIIRKLEVSINSGDWLQLRNTYPLQTQLILDSHLQLIQAIFSHPPNPYNCHLLEIEHRDSLYYLLQNLSNQYPLEENLDRFCTQLQQPYQMMYASTDRTTQGFSIHIVPVIIDSILKAILTSSPVVVVTDYLASNNLRHRYQIRTGLIQALSVQFSPHPQQEQIQLYIPSRIPLPNTPQYQGVVILEIERLLKTTSDSCVVLVKDIPLKAQIATAMAAEFGKRVSVDRTDLPDGYILVCGWEFWIHNYSRIPPPQMLIITTLPIPSVENPLVSSRVAYHKSQRQNWFEVYLLPTALRDLQKAVMPLRTGGKMVAILDHRVNSRSYGAEVLEVLQPYFELSVIK